MIWCFVQYICLNLPKSFKIPIDPKKVLGPFTQQGMPHLLGIWYNLLSTSNGTSSVLQMYQVAVLGDFFLSMALNLACWWSSDEVSSKYKSLIYKTIPLLSNFIPSPPPFLDENSHTFYLHGCRRVQLTGKIKYVGKNATWFMVKAKLSLETMTLLLGGIFPHGRMCSHSV